VAEPRPANAKAAARIAELEARLAASLAREAALGEALAERNRDVTEALERQTALSDILQVISHSPTEIQPVLDAIVSTAKRLVGADTASIWREQDGVVRRVAEAGSGRP
jgi:hypothetical protein